MKLLLSLILIIAFASSLIDSKLIRDDADCVSEFSSISGYNSNFKAVSFNSNQPQSSFYESGYLSLDLKNQKMMTKVQINYGGQQTTAQSFIFAKNLTQYVIINDECTQVQFSGDFPSSINNLVKVGDSSIGSINVEVLEPSTQIPSSNIQILVDSKLCSPLSIETTNDDQTYTLLNIYNYESSVVPSDFDLPAQCQQSQDSKTQNIQKLIKSHSQLLNHLF